MILALMLIGIGTFFVLLWTCAVYALPLGVGLWAGLWAMQAGAGVGSLAIGAVASTTALVACQVILAINRSPVTRWIVLTAFAAPAMIAGYSMILQLAELGGTPSVWCHVLALAGAGLIGCAAIARLGSDSADAQRSISVSEAAALSG